MCNIKLIRVIHTRRFGVRPSSSSPRRIPSFVSRKKVFFFCFAEGVSPVPSCFCQKNFSAALVLYEGGLVQHCCKPCFLHWPHHVSLLLKKAKRINIIANENIIPILTFGNIFEVDLHLECFERIVWCLLSFFFELECWDFSNR